MSLRTYFTNWLLGDMREQIALHKALMNQILEIIRKDRRDTMARIEELRDAVTAVATGIARVATDLEKAKADLAASGTEDPRIGEAVDALKEAAAKLDTISPPPAPDPIAPPPS